MSTSLTTGTPWRVIHSFSVPLLIGNVVQQLYQFADTIVVGRQLGVTSLAAVGATGSILFLLLGFVWGLSSGFAIPTAQAFGAKDAVAVRRSVATGTILTAIASVLLAVLGPLLAEPMLVAMQTPASLLPEATVFAQVSFVGSAGMLFFNYLAAIIRAIGDSRTPLVFLTISCALNVALVIVFVGPFGWGVAGAAWATVVAQGVSVLLCLEYVRRRMPELHVQRADWRVTRSDLGRHLQLGLPMGFQASIIAIGALAVQIRLNALGEEAVAAYTAAARVDGLAATLLQSLGLAVSMFVAQNLGGGRPDRIRTGVVQATWMAVIGSVTLGVALIAAGAPLVHLFVGEAAHVVDLAATMLLVHGFTYTMLGVLFVLRGALQGLGSTLIPTVTGILELGARVLGAVVLGAVWGFFGVVWSNPLAWLAALVVLIPAYVRAHRALGRRAVSPNVMTMTTPIAVIGPSEGAGVVDAVVTAPIPVIPAASRRRRRVRRLGSRMPRPGGVDRTE